jgi:tetratricopeptide (TPR) repeat protein
LSDGTVLYYKALCLEQMGRDDDALKAFQNIVTDWPDATTGPLAAQRLIFPAWEGAARIHLKRRDVESAAVALQEAVDRPDAPADLFVTLSSLYTDYKLPERGLRILEQGAAGTAPPRAAESLAALHVAWARLARQTGDTASMTRMADSLGRRGGELAARGDYVVDLSLVRAYAIAGREAEALDWLRKAIAAGYTQVAWMKDDPDLAGISSLPEFARLAAGLAPGKQAP